MNRLLLFNLATDANDPVLGFTTLWINRLAAHWNHIDVITMRAGRLDVSPNVSVYSVGKEHGFSEARRALEFYRLLLTLLIRHRYAASFAHMMPLFTVMSAPLLKLIHVPITLWYTHRQNSRTLEWATKWADHVVTAAPDSFPINTPKLRVIGHGIDTAFFKPSPNPAHRETRFTVVHIARLMPIKHQAALIRAAARLPELRVIFVGDVPPEIDAAYKADLETLADQLGARERVTFAGSLDRIGVRDHLWKANAAVNLSPPGLFDKAALESMAVGVPTIVSSEAFRPLLGDHADALMIPAPDDPDALVNRLETLMRMGAADRDRLSADIRARTVAQHSLDGLISRLNNVLKMGEP